MERTIKQSSALGAISQSLGGISEKVKRAEEIEQRLIEGQVIVELDPSLIDNSFVRDRMEATEEQNAAFREIIRQHGQNVPILVRRNPSNGERYEVAFGHRRLRAARELGIRVRAVVRSLTDEELVVAQGQENSGRTDLTFIERARFAARLEDRKFSREIIMSALNVDKAALSRLIAVATRIPGAVIDAIGPAPPLGASDGKSLRSSLKTRITALGPWKWSQGLHSPPSIRTHALRRSQERSKRSRCAHAPKPGFPTTGHAPPEFPVPLRN